MVMTKAKELVLVKLKIENNLKEQVKQFKYLRSTLTNDGRCLVEIRQSISMAKRAFTQKDSCL